MSRYILDRSWEPERRRLTLLQELLDPLTIDHLERIGVGPGWSCLEVGAGAGSIALWMSERVGSSGKVVAVDLDTALIDDLRRPNLQVRSLDVMSDELPSGFDLVHFRALVGHLADPDEGLRRIHASLRPGGWLLAEEADSLWALVEDPPTWPPQAQAVRAKVSRALTKLWKESGFDPWWGRNLLARLSELGMQNLDGEVRSPLLTGHLSDLQLLSVSRFREELIARGDITAQDYESFAQFTSDPEWRSFLLFLTSIWGQKPES